jgi:hypothetical protein
LSIKNEHKKNEQGYFFALDSDEIRSSCSLYGRLYRLQSKWRWLGYLLLDHVETRHNKPALRRIVAMGIPINPSPMTLF